MGDDARTPPADVLRVLDRLGMAPVAFTPVGGFPRWHVDRITFRVDLADGTTVKVRRVTKAARPTRAAALVRALDDPRLAPPLAMEGRVAVEAWVAGTPLQPTTITTQRVHEAADLLASLHARSDVPGHPFRRTGSVAPVRERALRHLAELHTGGVLHAHERQELTARIGRDLPIRATRGVVHGDLCPDNLVVTDDGALVSVDNERVRIDFLDHDLARTWTRWPMTRDHEREFFARYRAHGRDAPPRATEDAWRICTTVKSACTLRRTPDTGAALARTLLDRLFEHLHAAEEVDG